MSGRIETRFAALHAQGRTALIPFITAGDPIPDATVELMHALVENGADLIELGVPFSDPMADGPVIQHADERALRNHVSIVDILGWVRAFRERDVDTPIVLMGYLNPIEIHGIECFAREAKDAGVDGVLIVDCPIEEDAALQPLRDAGLRRILLAAPTTSDARLARAVEMAEGYLYYVSFAGITGAAKLSARDIAQRVGAIRQRAQVPVAVGFGIKDAVSAKAVAAFADAVVIGSALVGTLADAIDANDACRRAGAFLDPIRAALDGR
ncbi:MAG: Tryptophan synthase alpha chain [Rhodanobacteraceae bacterium]|jgi:tryptophan synthase alpha chain|nr:MAG: Tryptophan synthase alpha chain [Rhodanobacteraceae bacterium]